MPVTLLRRQRASDPLPLLLWEGFDFAHRFQQRDNVADHALPFLDVRDFTPTEDDRHNHFVLVLEEPTCLIDFEFDIVIARLGSNANFFDFALMDVGLVLLFLLLVLEFAEVHDSANGRPLVGGHFDQIQIRVPCLLKCLFGRDDSKLSSLGRNDPNRRDPNLLVNPL